MLSVFEKTKFFVYFLLWVKILLKNFTKNKIKIGMGPYNLFAIESLTRCR